MVYKKSKRKNNLHILVGLYLTLSILAILFAFNLFAPAKTQEVDEAPLYQAAYATFDFQQEVVMNEKGEEEVINLIETPEQLAGFAIMNTALDKGDIKIVSPVQLDDDIFINGERFSGKDLGSSTYLGERLIGKAKDLFEDLLSNINTSPSTSSPSAPAPAQKPTPTTIGSWKDTHTSYKIVEDIDMSPYEGQWSAIELESGVVLDGDFHTISNFSIDLSQQNVGFVSRNYGTIKNLTFENVTIKNSITSNTWSITGVVCGWNSGTIESVTVNSGSVKGNNKGQSSYRAVGGIAGYMDSNGTIKSCTNKATVSNGNYVGGIVGYVNSGNISNCFNQNAISASNEDASYIGGIVGEIHSGSVKLCVNMATVMDNTSDKIYAGGVVGVSYVKLEQCGNEGTVYAGYDRSSYDSWDSEKTAPYGNTSSGSSLVRIGGVVGYVTGDVSDCYNRGGVSGAAKPQTSSSTNMPKMIADDGVELRHNYFGMHISMRDGTWTKSSCSCNTYQGIYNSTYYYNHNDFYIGGIAGYSSGKIEGSYNTSYISPARTRVLINYSLYFKWYVTQGNGNFSMLVHDTFSYAKEYTYGAIVGKTTGSVSSCVDVSSTPRSKTSSLSGNHHVEAMGGVNRNSSFSGWSLHNSGGDNWYVDYSPNGSWSYHTAFAIDASSISQIKFKGHFCGGAGASEREFFVLDTGISSSTLSFASKCGTQKSTKTSIRDVCSSSNWGSANTEYNNGYPYLKGLYW